MTNNNKPSRQEMVEAIYEKIADKNLSFGCKFQLKTGAITTATGEPSGTFITCLFFQQTRLENIEKIIGHPVMIGDVIDFIYNELLVIIISNKIINVVNRDGEKIKTREEFEVNSDTAELLYFWKEKRKPIEEQLDRCIEFVYNLIS